MFTPALLAALCYLLIFCVDESFAWQTLVRPIVTGPIVGAVLGDLNTGIIMGASLEAIYMGIVNSGGAAPADAYSATVICVTFVIAGGLDMEAGLVLALPIGTLMTQLNPLTQPIHGYFIKVFDGFLEKGDTRSFEILQHVYRFLFSRLVQTIVIFFSIYVGVESVQKGIAVLPVFILNGLKAAGGMLPAVGLGVLLMMTWSKEMGAMLIVGFVLSVYLNLNSMAIALIGGAIAVVFFFLDISNKKDVAASKKGDIF